MASAGSDQDVRYALSKLLQRGTVAEYESEFLMLIKRVTGISESLLKSFYISGLKPLLQWKKKKNGWGKTLREINIVLSWPSEEAPHANEDIGVIEFNEFSKNKESVEDVVVGGGEACGVGDDELNRVIPALKDGGV
ncbi:hypothetical protein Tco_0066449 [Tanacetum coccineum]